MHILRDIASIEATELHANSAARQGSQNTADTGRIYKFLAPASDYDQQPRIDEIAHQETKQREGVGISLVKIIDRDRQRARLGGRSQEAADRIEEVKSLLIRRLRSGQLAGMISNVGAR